MDSSEQPTKNRRAAVRASRKTIPQLPEEMLIAIMKWLTVDERKIAKSVCKDWFYASTAFDKEEKFCIGSKECQRDLDQILLTLSKSTRQCFHLEFYGAYFGGIPRTEFWRTCGPNIISLKLIDCVISGTCFAGLLRYCCNLRMLELYFHDLGDMKFGLGIQVPSKSIPSKLKNSSLQTLKIHFGHHPSFGLTFCIFVLRALFNVFPNIADFSFCHSPLNDRNHSLPRGDYTFCSTRDAYKRREALRRARLFLPTAPDTVVTGKPRKEFSRYFRGPRSS